jgi:hypothetical protein
LARGPDSKSGFSPDPGEQLVQHASALERVGHEASASRQVDPRGLLEVKHELGIGTGGLMCIEKTETGATGCEP